MQQIAAICAGLLHSVLEYNVAWNLYNLPESLELRTGAVGSV